MRRGVKERRDLEAGSKGILFVFRFFFLFVCVRCGRDDSGGRIL